MKNKRNWAKKVIKFRMQKDWMITLTVTFTFLFLDWFGEIDWKWYWLLSPIWLLLSIYFICTVIGMSWYYFIRRKEVVEKGGRFYCQCMDAPYSENMCKCGRYK